jgi:hypothetical protein
METSTGITTILRQDKVARAVIAQESRRMVKAALATPAQAPFLFRHFRLYARIRLNADPPRALLDDIPACAITL